MNATLCHRLRAAMVLGIAAFSAALAGRTGAHPDRPSGSQTSRAVADPARPPGMGLEAVCDLPPDLRDVRGHLLFEYRMDPAGRVQDVQPLYVSVEPEARRGAFTAALAECVRQWAHPPEAGGGEGRATHLVPFHYFRPAPERDPVGVLPDGRSYPLAWFEEVHREKLKLAEAILKRGGPALLGGGKYLELEGPGWVLRTNVREADARSLRDALEYAGRAFEASFPGVPPAPAEAVLTVLLFQSDREFEQIAAFDNFMLVPGQPAGRYTSWDRTIYASASDLPLPLITGVIVHEATHHLVWQRLYARGRNPPLWVNEGIANFIQCVKPAPSGGIDLGAIDRGRILRYPQVWSRPAEEYLDLLAESAAASRLPPLADLLGGRLDAEFHGPRQKLLYGTAWLAVHYLLNAGGGKHREPFQAWLLGPASEGEGKALGAAIGRTPEQMEAEVRAHLEGLVEAPGIKRGPDGLALPLEKPGGGGGF